MSDKNLPMTSKEGTILFYEGQNGKVRVEISYVDETFWLTQRKMAELLDVDVRTISEHLKNIFADKELAEEATIRKFRIVRIEGNRQVTREIEHYTLDAVISVGYRVNSIQAMTGYFSCHYRMSDYTGLNNTRQGSALMRILNPAGYLFLEG